MATVELPDPVPEIEPMRSRPSEAGMVGTDFRTVAAELQNVQSWSDRAAAPTSFQGNAADAAHHAGTRFARRADVAEEALQLATVATTRFEDRLVRLRHRRTTLELGREHLNADIHTTRQQINRVEIDDQQAAQKAVHLHNRRVILLAAIEEWRSHVTDAEAAYIAALRRIDTVAEARQVASTTTLPDTGALMRHLRSLKGDVRAINHWWFSLSVAERQAMMIAYPGIVGATTGIPITGRDRANRANVEAMRGYLNQRKRDGQLTEAERRALDNLDALQDVIHDHRHDVDPVTGRNNLNVIEYDPYAYDGDGTSVISLGNPDHARYVATYTPGFKSLGGQLTDTGSMENLYHAMGADHRGVATILFENYDAPSVDGLRDVTHPGTFDAGVQDAAGVANVADAQAGGHRLAGFLNSLDATHHGTPGEVTVIGHSYGSVVAAYAAHEQPDIDNVVLLANPGVPGHDVHDLVGDSGIHVYVGADDHDPVSLLGKGPLGGLGTLGNDPAAASYGADRIGEDPSPESVKGVMLFGNHSSSHYLGAGSTGLRNVAALATGGDPDLVPGRTGSNYESLGDLIAHSALNATPDPRDDFLYDHGGKQVLGLVGDVVPDGAKHAVASSIVDAVTGDARVLDGGLHAVDHVTGTLAPFDPAAGLVHSGTHALTPLADDITHDVESVAGALKGLLS